VIHAADDAEAIAQAERMRGSFPAELLDVEGLRIVKCLNSRTGRFYQRVIFRVQGIRGHQLLI
jgi:hypothetical protein